MDKEYHLSNKAAANFNKIVQNRYRMQRAARQSHMIQHARQRVAADGLAKWDAYREQKIEAIALFVRVMKRQNLVKQLATMARFSCIMRQFVVNFGKRKRLMKLRMSAIFLGVKFKSLVKRRRKQYGAHFKDRFRNLIRQKMVCTT